MNKCTTAMANAGSRALADLLDPSALRAMTASYPASARIIYEAMERRRVSDERAFQASCHAARKAANTAWP